MKEICDFLHTTIFHPWEMPEIQKPLNLLTSKTYSLKPYPAVLSSAITLNV
jgi:hypothetical protein